MLKKLLYKLYIYVAKNKRLKDDSTYVKALFYVKNKFELNLKTPQTFADKINWLKLYKYDSSYNVYVDKYTVRAIISDKIGDNYLNEIYGVYQDVDEIPIDNLPKSFVLKYTHSSGHNLIVKDKSTLNWKKEKRDFSTYAKLNYYFKYRERVYDKMTPKIIVEKYLSELDNDDLIDYKFYCVHGQPKYVLVKTIEDGKAKKCFYDMNWVKLVPEKEKESYLYTDIKQPENFDEMISVAKTLAESFVFIRVDLYSVANKVFFGELTFFPQGGKRVLAVESLNNELGAEIHLPEN